MKEMKGKKAKRSRGPTLGSLAVEALREAVAFEYGEKTGATVRTVTARRAVAEPAPEYKPSEIAKLRHRLRLSQPLFADVLNVSSASVKAWEQGQNEPGGAALRLLQIAEAHPEIILERITPRENS